jgi:hypothetical protein
LQTIPERGGRLGLEDSRRLRRERSDMGGEGGNLVPAARDGRIIYLMRLCWKHRTPEEVRF